MLISNNRGQIKLMSFSKHILPLMIVIRVLSTLPKSEVPSSKASVVAFRYRVISPGTRVISPALGFQKIEGFKIPCLVSSHKSNEFLGCPKGFTSNSQDVGVGHACPKQRISPISAINNPLKKAYFNQFFSSLACQRTNTRRSNASPNRCHSLLLRHGCRSHPSMEGTLESPSCSRRTKTVRSQRKLPRASGSERSWP